MGKRGRRRLEKAKKGPQEQHRGEWGRPVRKRTTPARVVRGSHEASDGSSPRNFSDLTQRAAHESCWRDGETHRGVGGQRGSRGHKSKVLTCILLLP